MPLFYATTDLRCFFLLALHKFGFVSEVECGAARGRKSPVGVRESCGQKQPLPKPDAAAKWLAGTASPKG